MKNLKEKVVLITGAGSGIGQATACEFAKHGARLVISDIDEKGLSITAEKLVQSGCMVLQVKADVSKKDDVKALAEKAIEKFGRVDVLINNAGVGMAAEIRDMDISEWEWIIGINLWGTIHTLNYVLPHMIKQGSGHIVNISSAVGLVSFVPIQAAYTTTKFALVGLSEVLRTEMEPHGIGVSVICPGSVKTPFFITTRFKGFSSDVMDFVPDFVFASAEQVARKIVMAVKRNRAVVVITWLAKLVYYTKRISPYMARMISRMNMNRFLQHKIEISGQQK